MTGIEIGAAVAAVAGLLSTLANKFLLSPEEKLARDRYKAAQRAKKLKSKIVVSLEKWRKTRAK